MLQDGTIDNNRIQVKRMRNPRSIMQAIDNRFTRFSLKANRGPLGIALLGVGGWGASNATNIMRSRRFNIVGVHDIQAGLATRFATRFRTKSYAGMEELWNDSTTQSVCITVPNHFHLDMVKACADAGKHVFIEKPLASDADDCRKIGQYCKDRQIALQVGHQVRRDPAFKEIKRILNSQALGRLLFIQGVTTLDRQGRDDWRQDPDLCPGGSMEQLGVHLIDVLISLIGLPRETCGWAQNIPPRSEAPDWTSVSLTFDHEIHATISTSFSSPSHMRLEFFFDRGHLATDGQTLWIKSGHSNVRILKPHGLPGGVVQFLEFADCIECGQRPETGSDEAYAIMKVVQSIPLGKMIEACESNKE